MIFDPRWCGRALIGLPALIQLRIFGEKTFRDGPAKVVDRAVGAHHPALAQIAAAVFGAFVFVGAWWLWPSSAAAQ
jgi:hypothetical protein